jgi:4-amino-4-deoxy-L-arabinose transferase-like glycosyltransferase
MVVSGVFLAPAPLTAPRGRPWPSGGPPCFLLVLALYAAIHIGLRLLLSPVVAIDDSREALFSQTLQRGYLAQQPPLYTWLAWASVRFWGVSTTSLVVCRYATLSVLYLFLYLSAAHLLRHGTLAMLAAFSLVLVAPFTWDAHTELTHSLTASAAAAATLYALLRVGRLGSTLAYLGLGVAIAAGLLAKFSYGLFVGALLAGAIATPEYRRPVLAPRFGLTVGIAVLLCLPYALWFVGHEVSLASVYAEQIRQVPVSYRRGVTRGLFHLGRMIVVYVLPFALVFLAVFRGTWTRREATFPGARRLLGVLLLVQVGILIAGTLTGQLTYFRVRWLMPVFVLAPLFAFTWIDPMALDRRRIARYVAILLIVETLVVLGLLANVLRGDAFGVPTRLNAPYDAVADTLATAGFTRGTIAAGEGPLAGNLRLHFPDSRVIRLSSPDYLPPATGEGQCLVVWEEPGGSSELVSWVASALGARVEAESSQRISVRYRHARAHSLEVRYILMPTGRGECR